MPNLTANASVTIQGTERLFGGLDIHIQPVAAALDVTVATTETKVADPDIAVAFPGATVGATLDMWISDGGVLAQLFALDTEVSTPLIVGDHLVSDPGVGILYEIVNLDPDVVAIALGPSSLGVLSLAGFLNNGDGTGRFFANFDTSVPTRQLTIVATDDVDNESAESPVFIVHSLEQARLGDVFTILPQATVSTDTCNRLIDAIPDSAFTLRRRHTVPFSFNDTTFELRAVTPGDPVEIQVLRRAPAGENDETQRYIVIPDQEVMLVSLRLGRGVNIITAADSQTRVDTVIVAATTYASVMCSYAREIFNNSQVLIDEQQTAIFSPISTRLAESLLQFADLLPDVKSQQVLATKLAVRSLIHDPGRQQGVEDMITALTLSTPIIVPQIASADAFEPAVVPLYRVQEGFAGVEAHVWPVNQCIQRWLAFIRYLASVPVFQIIEVTENEILFLDENRVARRHVFDFAAKECSLTTLALQAICFDNIDVSILIFSTTLISICTATYPFDMRATPRAPFHPLADEFGVELALDPGFDGYAEVSITDRWDGGNPLDTQGPMVAAGSALPGCVHGGYLMRPLLLASTSPTINAAPTIDIIATPQTARAADLDLLLDLAGIEKPASLDMYIGLTVKTVGADLIVESTESVEAGIDIVISL